eukprot:GHVT01088128.1.p1 GENE.GHVT01088128.1~~GHVT01088128.1.p1  ORF type:complete len:173 (-),score=35.04 GHVT01088128.1:744-1262(-)
MDRGHPRRRGLPAVRALAHCSRLAPLLGDFWKTLGLGHPLVLRPRHTRRVRPYARPLICTAGVFCFSRLALCVLVSCRVGSVRPWALTGVAVAHSPCREATATVPSSSPATNSFASPAAKSTQPHETSRPLADKSIVNCGLLSICDDQTQTRPLVSAETSEHALAEPTARRL